MKIYYNPKLKPVARNLRKRSTLSEVLLWRHLKNKQMMGYDFHRQKPIVEVDKKREKRLGSHGFFILHFLDVDVKQNMEGVILAIREWIKLHTPKSPLNRGDFSKIQGEIPSKKRGVSKRRGV